MKKTANIWEHKVGMNGIIAKFAKMSITPKQPSLSGRQKALNHL